MKQYFTNFEIIAGKSIFRCVSQLGYPSILADDVCHGTYRPVIYPELLTTQTNHDETYHHNLGGTSCSRSLSLRPGNHTGT